MLVLLRNPEKPSGVPFSYRPICLLGTIERLDRVINNWLLPFTELVLGFLEWQYGFRPAPGLA